jgi:uncharacterized membrane protein required for colicin V production
MLNLVMAEQIQDFFGGLAFSYMDAIVLVWLVAGLLRGRKHGMTQELLPALKWVAIVLLAGYFNQPLAAFIREGSNGAFSPLWSLIAAYALIALVLALLFALLRHGLGDKLTGSDLFGRYEYYSGMLAGLVRFACMVLVLLAVMHSRIVTQPELDAINAQMKKNLDDIHPPRYIYGSIEQAIFFQSFTGRSVQEYLPDLLIPTVAPPEVPKADSIKKKLQDAIDNPLGTGKK